MALAVVIPMKMTAPRSVHGDVGSPSPFNMSPAPIGPGIGPGIRPGLERRPLSRRPRLLVRSLVALLLAGTTLMTGISGHVASARAAAVRLKELVDVQGMRENALYGYGLVVGLAGTGDTEYVFFTSQSISGRPTEVSLGEITPLAI